MADFGKYLLWQGPGWILVAAALAWAVGGPGLPVWVAVVVLVLVVGRDVALYPVIRSAFAKPPYHSAPVGSTGRVVEPLEPSGYVQVNGELWRAVVQRPAGHQPIGARVVVREARGLTLLVEPRARIVD